MPTNTYTALATITLTGTDSSIDFANIPSTYRDLVLVYHSKQVSSSTYSGVTFNGDASNVYTGVHMKGDGSSATSAAATNTSLNPFAYFYESTTEFLAAVVNIMDYSATDKHKTVLCRGNVASQGTEANAYRWPSTAAVNSVSVISTGSFAIGSTFSLYGIAS